MKVCHMTSAHGPEDDRIFLKECVSLAHNGYEVYQVSQGGSYEKHGIHIVGVGEKPTGRLKRMTSFAKNIYEAALAVDAAIYHFHDPELLPYGLKLKKKGKKVIFDSHELYVEQIRSKLHIPAWVSTLISKFYGHYERYVLKQIDAVILPCTFDGINPFVGLCRRTLLISNAAILSEFFDRYDPDTPKKERQLCYVGGLTEARGITASMKASHRAGARLALAGNFSPPEYEQRLKAMPESSCLDYRGILDRGGVAALLSESQVGLCVLLDVGEYWKMNTLNIKGFEYMSMGLPVVLSASTYNKKMVERYGFGLCVDPENTEEFATAVQYLLDHPDEARQMGENGRKAVKEEFNWGVEEKKLLALYEEILNE